MAPMRAKPAGTENESDNEPPTASLLRGRWGAPAQPPRGSRRLPPAAGSPQPPTAARRRALQIPSISGGKLARARVLERQSQPFALDLADDSIVDFSGVEDL